MIKKDELFETGDKERIWQKYCGFLDLSLKEFMEIQEQLLKEQIDLVHNSPLAKKFMPKKPENVSEFRSQVPLTTYKDYSSILNQRKNDVTSKDPYSWWVHTSGRSGSFKWVPYTERAHRRLINSVVTGFILGSATRKGEVNIQGRERILYNLPTRPYFSGMIATSVFQLYDFQSVLNQEVAEKMEFQDRIAEGFKLSLRTGVDLLASMSSILVKIGESFEEGLQGMKLSTYMLHPAVLYRLARGVVRSKLEGRNLLPKDLWTVKAIICGGTDTSIYREKINHYWGTEPIEYYGGTEAGVVATQNWNRKGMTFIPSSAFYEFMPEKEWLKNKQDKAYQPSTVLLSEVEEGKSYELVITSFYGMPFLRYRLGDLIQIISLSDDDTGVNLPQMVFESRADDLIDIAGFTRLDEKTVWQAMANSGIGYVEWTIRKEHYEGEPILRLYLEMKEEKVPEEVESVIHDSLKAVNSGYCDLGKMLEVNPLKITILSKGTFMRFYIEKQAAGLDLAHLKPPHTNASDSTIDDLLRLSGWSETQR
jgi:hypothetical protein